MRVESGVVVSAAALERRQAARSARRERDLGTKRILRRRRLEASRALYLAGQGPKAPTGAEYFPTPWTRAKRTARGVLAAKRARRKAEKLTRRAQR